MIHVISAKDRHLYGDAVEEHFRIRHQIFVGERGWKTLERPDGREIDQYDNNDTIYLLALEKGRVVGGHRLYPTTKPNMISEVFPHLAAVSGCPSAPDIWEWSRYFIVPDRRDGDLNLRLMAAVQEFCLEEGITRVSAVIEMWWLPRFQQAGFVLTPLGVPALIENAWTIATLIEISETALRSVNARFGATRVLHRPSPQHRHASAGLRTGRKGQSFLT
ncbi:GNAT family N-acetyltransferase [Rhodopseudomonas sp. HC1]|uniref:acyl-homoserine-lactone synthase n=1 Tax=Rhodopseudomonas infernalis TaxID=2897386 RepID=UPI001EE8013A|nr:GNAT family N-acetyltransferase [Rhodopseudomonas infernalis]MCG6205846.1 GNAT family N-acetyltransferase [Rhodopseudomonas infernalis]